MSSPLDYLAHVAAESERFAVVLRDADPAGPVPTCPDWSAADLLWHLAEVHSFWAEILDGRLQSPEVAEERAPARPEGYDDLLALGRHATGRLLAALTEAGSDAPVWTWSTAQSSGFVLRWQAHEALMHRHDAELAARVPHAPVDALLAADGVDAALTIAFAWRPAWATFTPDGAVIDVVASDAARRWRLHAGQMTGTSPNTGKTYDERILEAERADGASGTAATVVTASDVVELDRWLWSRGGAPPVQDGDPELLAFFVGIVAGGMQ